MEGPNKPTLEEQVNLAETLYEATEERNDFSKKYPDWDDMVVFVNASPENREAYENMERKANEARTRFDEAVTDKKALVKHLRTTGEADVADRIAMMFNVK